MNKARMTFRFDEGQGRQLEDKEQTEQVEQSVFDWKMNGYRNEKAEDKLIPPDRPVRDHLSAVPGSMQGWGDPFSHDDKWNGSPYQEIIPLDDEQPDDPERFGLDDTGFDASESFEKDGPQAGIPAVEEFSYRPHSPASLWKVIGTVTGAIVTGALFGFVVLSFFKDGSGGTPMGTKQGVDGHTSAITATAEANPTGPSPEVAVDIQSQSYYMLQYGVFSTSDRVEQAKKELQQYGIAAGNDADHENRVYAAISTDREQAMLLSNQLKAQGVELYVREITLPAESSLHFSGDTGTADHYFTVSSKLVELLSQTSASLLVKDQPLPLSSENMTSLTDMHRQWTEASKSFQTGLTSEQEKLGKQLEQTMNSALSSVEEYNKNSSKGHLWEIQSNMMQFIIQQKELMTTME